MNRSRASAIHEAKWKQIKSDALDGSLPALQTCCTALVRMDSKSPQANALFHEMHDVLRVNFRVEDAPPDPTGVYDFLDENHERLRVISYCMDILLFGISTTDEGGSAPIIETVWPAFWRWSILVLTLFKDGWTPILLGMGVDEHIKFIHSVDAVILLLNGRSQKIKALRKSTPDLVLPLFYVFLSLESSPLCKLNAISGMKNLIFEYVAQPYRVGATFDPIALLEGAAYEVAGLFLSCFRRAVENKSRIDYAILVGHTTILNMISESESYVQVGRHLAALRITYYVTRLLRIVGDHYSRVQTHSSEMSFVCRELLQYLARTAFSSGAQGVRSAMAARLLDALISLHGLALHDQTLGPQRSNGIRDAVLLVTKLAQHYLVFRSFITLSSKCFQSLKDRRLLVDNPGAELVDSFRVLLRDRARLKERMDQSIYTCQNPQCSPRSRTRPRAYGRCSGCKFAVYCSRICQRAHWDLGHRLDCQMSNDKSWHYLSFQDKRFLEFLVTYTLNEQSAKIAKHFSRLIGRSSGITDNVRIDFTVENGLGDISFHSAHGMGPPGIFAALAPDSCWMCIVLPVYEKGVDFLPRFSILKLKTRRGNESPQTAVTAGVPEIHQGISFIVWDMYLP